MNRNPDTLYHSSMYLQDELMPGFKRSGKLVEWDHMESNRFLYATTEREQALVQGFASAVEKTWKVVNFQARGRRITVTIDGPHPSVADVHGLQIYLYTIRFDPIDGWQKNNNPFNGMLTEWVTQATIQANIEQREALDVKHWLSSYRLEFIPHGNTRFPSA